MPYVCPYVLILLLITRFFVHADNVVAYKAAHLCYRVLALTLICGFDYISCTPYVILAHNRGRVFVRALFQWFVHAKNTPFVHFGYINKLISSTDGRGRVLTGISPRHGSHAALLIACDAFNARTVTAREYQYTDLCVLARKPPRLRYGVVSIARSRWGSHGAPAARLGID